MSWPALAARIIVIFGCYAFAIWMAFEAAWWGCLIFVALAVAAVVATMLEVGRR